MFLITISLEARASETAKTASKNAKWSRTKTPPLTDEKIQSHTRKIYHQRKKKSEIEESKNC